MEADERGTAGKTELLVEADDLQATPYLPSRTLDGDPQDPGSHGTCKVLGVGGWRQNWKVLKLEVEPNLRPVPTTDLLGQIVQVNEAVTEETLLRFKSTRRLSTEVTTQFQAALRLEGAPIWSTLQTWIGQSGLQTAARPTAVQSCAQTVIVHPPYAKCILQHLPLFGASSRFGCMDRPIHLWHRYSGSCANIPPRSSLFYLGWYCSELGKRA